MSLLYTITMVAAGLINPPSDKDASPLDGKWVVVKFIDGGVTRDLSAVDRKKLVYYIEFRGTTVTRSGQSVLGPVPTKNGTVRYYPKTSPPALDWEE